MRRSWENARYLDVTYKAEHKPRFLVQKELRQMFEKQEVSLDII